MARPPNSWVWEHFRQDTTQPVNANHTLVVCQICNKVLRYSSRNGPTNLARHLIRSHHMNPPDSHITRRPFESLHSSKEEIVTINSTNSISNNSENTQSEENPTELNTVKSAIVPAPQFSTDANTLKTSNNTSAIDKDDGGGGGNHGNKINFFTSNNEPNLQQPPTFASSTMISNQSSIQAKNTVDENTKLSEDFKKNQMLFQSPGLIDKNKISPSRGRSLSADIFLSNPYSPETNILRGLNTTDLSSSSFLPTSKSEYNFTKNVNLFPIYRLDVTNKNKKSRMKSHPEFNKGTSLNNVTSNNDVTNMGSPLLPSQQYSPNFNSNQQLKVSQQESPTTLKLSSMTSGAIASLGSFTTPKHHNQLDNQFFNNQQNFMSPLSNPEFSTSTVKILSPRANDHGNTSITINNKNNSVSNNDITGTQNANGSMNTTFHSNIENYENYSNLSSSSTNAKQNNINDSSISNVSKDSLSENKRSINKGTYDSTHLYDNKRTKLVKNGNSYQNSEYSPNLTHTLTNQKLKFQLQQQHQQQQQQQQLEEQWNQLAHLDQLGLLEPMDQLSQVNQLMQLNQKNQLNQLNQTNQPESTLSVLKPGTSFPTMGTFSVPTTSKPKIDLHGNIQTANVSKENQDDSKNSNDSTVDMLMSVIRVLHNSIINVENELTQQRMHVINLEQRVARSSNEKRGAGLETAYDLLPWIGVSDQLPLLTNIYVVFSLTEDQLDSYLKLYGIVEKSFTDAYNNKDVTEPANAPANVKKGEDNGNMEEGDKNKSAQLETNENQNDGKSQINEGRKEKVFKLSKFIGCEDVEKYWELYSLKR